MQVPLILGSTRLVGLLGDPVEHSLSPLIHNHAFAVLGIPYVYVPLRVKSADMHSSAAALRAWPFVGANITIPHKRRIVPYCDALSPLSTAVGAVNTLYFDKGLMVGTTTDAEGFFRALTWMGHDPVGGHIVIVGSGGVARTLAFTLAMRKTPGSLAVIGRNREKVSALVNEVVASTGFPVAGSDFSAGACREMVRECSLLVNCTSVGMYPAVDSSPISADWLHGGMTVFDTIYNPATTKLLIDARRAGCATQNGLRMLLYQALASLKIWTGRDVPETIFDIEELQRGATGSGALTRGEERP